MGIAIVRELESYLGGRSRFRSAINDHLIRKRDATQPRDRNGWISPSGMGGCQQHALNQLRGESMENMQDPWMDPFFAVANAIHDIYQEIGLKAGILRYGSVEAFVSYEPWKLMGQIDGMLRDEPVLLDFKSCNGRYFAMVEHSKRPLSWHRWQMHAYMLCTGCREVLMVYIDRETPNRLAEVSMHYDQDVVDEMEEWVIPVLGKYEDGTDFDIGDDCRNCEYGRYNLMKAKVTI